MATQTAREQPIEQTWNLDDIYAAPEEWEAVLDRVEADAAAVAAFQGRLGEGAGVLLACLRAHDALIEPFGRAAAYARLATAGDELGRERPRRANGGARRAFRGPTRPSGDSRRLPDGTIERFLAEDLELGVYRLQLEEVLRRRPHLLSLETEQALAALSEVFDAPGLIWRRATAVDVACPPIRDQRAGRRRSQSPAMSSACRSRRIARHAATPTSRWPPDSTATR